MKLSIQAGATSQSLNIFIQNNSVTTGSGLTGLVYNTSGLTAYYTFTGTNSGSTAITLATLAAANSAWSSGGFKEIDSTNMPGLYRLDLPNAVLAASKGQSVIVYLQGAANMAPCVLEVELTGWNNQDAVRGGLTALPNTACTTNASLLTSGNGTAQISTTAGQVLLQTGTGTGQLDFTSGVVKANLAQILGTALTETAGQIAAGFRQFFNIASPTSTMNTITALASTYDFAKGTVAMTEDYPVKGAAITPVQALYDMVQHMGEKSISSTTLTITKRNQTTAAKTFTLNNATTPTAITEAT